MNPVNKASRGDDKAAANCQTSDVGLVLNEKEITLDDGKSKEKSGKSDRPTFTVLHILINYR